ncbi:alpha/beta fold hydrolase [Roseibium marinum]|uniref:Pimeloyl-ACP methyl ester carboxylesterase n=1 Tax=Roseibium marinum TaxID=281252 RepID=A0A2S3UT37_9HYPH|nr:alpha/beta fold hydrolase [Roseibium marinum]POF30824.1 pimeloyl-ACP methyl ester carboxylesterase [Roseibium marinum]
MADPVVLIHGAWQGSWAWAHLVPHLEAEGLEVHAVDLPGSGPETASAGDITLETVLDHLDDVLWNIGRPVSLVGHSGGGIVASAAGERFRDRVTRIAYVAGMMLPSGMTFGDLQTELQGRKGFSQGISDRIVYSDDRLSSTVPIEEAAAIFFNDCPRDVAMAAAGKLTPQAEGARAILPILTPERFGTLPRLYVEATDDRSVVLLAQRRMQDLVPGATIRSLPTGHAPQLSAPELLSRALAPFLLGRK